VPLLVPALTQFPLFFTVEQLIAAQGILSCAFGVRISRTHKKFFGGLMDDFVMLAIVLALFVATLGLTRLVEQLMPEK
jgi:hypothetical protein